MSLPSSDALASVVARIPSPEEEPHSPGAGLSGVLGDLDTWWARRAGSSRPVVQVIVTTPESASADEALLQGLAAADRAIDTGATLLIPRVGRRDVLVARSIIGLLTKRDAAAVTYQPEGMPDGEWITDCAAVRDLMADHRHLLGEQLTMLEAMAAREVAECAGILIGAAARGTPCLIDGTDEWAGALIADRLAHRARHWWRGAATSPDPARAAARSRVDIPAALPLDLTDEEGWGARAVVTLLDLIDQRG